MPEAVVATPIEPVVATSSNPIEAPKARANPQESRLEDVINKINARHGGENKPAKSLNDIVAKVENNAKEEADATQNKLATLDIQAKAQKVEKPEPEAKTKAAPPQKEKLNVDGREIELDADQLRRFAQKGIHYEKRTIDLTKKEREIQGYEAKRAQDEAQKQQFFEGLGADPGNMLEKIFGPEIFERLKPWAAQRVQKEMEFEQNPHLAAIEHERAARGAAESKLRAIEQENQQRQIAAESQAIQAEYEKVITDALSTGGLPKTDFTVSEMAAHMERAHARKIEYTPQQLAQLVKEDNTLRVRAITDSCVSQITEARKNNDTATVVKVGDQLAEILGEPIIYAMNKYLLAKMGKNQQAAPKPILDTPKAQKAPEQKGYGSKGRQYMTMDEQAEMRGKILRGEIERPSWW